MKITTLILTIALPLFVMAQIENSAAPVKQVVKCKGKLDRYANNSAPMLEIGQLELKVMTESLTFRSAVVENKTLPLQDNYFVSVSGVLVRPGNPWNKTGSMMSLQFTLSKNEGGKTKYLSQSTVGTNSVRSPKQLEDLTNGKLKVQETLVDIDYVNEVANSKAKPAPDRVVNALVECELVNL